VSEITASPLCWPPGWRRCEVAHVGEVRRGVGGWVGVARAHIQVAIEVGDGVQRVLAASSRRWGSRRAGTSSSSDLKLRNDGLPYSTRPRSISTPAPPSTGATREAPPLHGDRSLRPHRRQPRRDRRDHRSHARDRAARRRRDPRSRVHRIRSACRRRRHRTRRTRSSGVSEKATLEEIDYAYRRLAQQCHPDTGGSHER
jgi:hypothetical protein